MRCVHERAWPFQSAHPGARSAKGSPVTAEDKRELRLTLLDDHIGRALAESEKSGELKTSSSYGKPLHFGQGYEQTPADLRMGYKILKDAGVLPPEVQLMRDIETLHLSLQDALDNAQTRAAQQRLVDMRLALALRLEKLRITGAM
jgi:Domain of unknown function (DUF1992)